MSDFVGSDTFEDENQDPTTRKPWRVSLSLQKKPREHDSDSVKAKKPQKALRASNEITESEYERMAVSSVPYNTKKNNDWAHKNFIAWRDARNAAKPDNKCPEGLLKKVPFDVDVLAYWLPSYAPETRTKTGKKYPASPFCVYLGPYCMKCGLYP